MVETIRIWMREDDGNFHQYYAENSPPGPAREGDFRTPYFSILVQAGT
jgi:hypothetical protein